MATGEEADGWPDMIEAVQRGGSATPLHLHARYEERIYVLDGELRVWAAEQLSLHAGGFYAIHRHVPHMIEAGPEGARVLNITSPAGFAELVQRAATPAHPAEPDTDLDLQLFRRMSSEYNVTLRLSLIALAPPIRSSRASTPIARCSAMPPVTPSISTLWLRL